MLTGLKKIFFGRKDHPVETYGKLPCYKDYISVVLTDGAAQWRTWLLESFQGKSMPPEGIWPFIYEHRKNSDLVIGVISASSDGIRQFPFTLFTVCRRARKGLCSRSQARSIWQELEQLYRQLVVSEDIQSFYSQLRGKKISPLIEKEIPDAEKHEFFYNREGEWPRMLVAGKHDSGTLHLVKDGRTTHEEFIQNWQSLIAAKVVL